MASKKTPTPRKATTVKAATRPRRTAAEAGPAAAPAAATPRFDPNAFDLWAATHLAGGPSAHRNARSGGGSDGALDLATLARPGAVLEVHFADGSTLYTAPGDFLRRHVPEPPPQRGAAGDAPARLVLPFDLAGRDGPRQRAAAAASAIERYAVSELTEPTTLDQLFDVAETFRQTARRWFGLDAGDAKALPLAAKLCAAYENAALHDALGSAGGVLLRWGADGWAPLAPGATLDAAGRPVLLLLHGTASSTEGSFGKLWGAAGDVQPDDFARLAQSHLLLAWEHRSLTLSPVDNAIGLLDALLAALPQRCRVDVLSHSRGGLVGELFSLRSADALDAAEAPFAALFGANAAEAAHPDHARIEPLFARLRAAKLRFEAGRFVRVACPARGTLLADGRTDLFLSLLLRAVSLASSGIAQVVVGRITALVRALVAARADARHLPGLEAMVPGSALTLALARCQAQPTDRLRVIAGDAAARGLSGILTLVADAFYGGHDHDYVVHTRSMFGGLQRVAHPPLSLRWEHAAVSHFAYFAPEQPARKALLGALAGQDDRYTPLADDEARTRGTRGVLQMMKSDPLVRRDFKQWRAGCNQPEQARKPVLVLLAGIMGSELKRQGAAKDDPVWLTLGSMIGGGLDALDLGRASADPLVASGLLAVSYERLLERAQAQFSVLCFPFDWRLPIADSGAAFAGQLQEVVDALADQGVPVHVLAHSMGGLVARHALYIDAGGRKLWGALKQRDSRLVMLGTPNRGAYAPAQLLLGQHSMSQVLGLLARKVSAGDLSRYGAGFPGLMAMLPQEPAAPFDDLFDPAAWDRIAALDSGTVRPQPAVLKAARDYVRGAAFQGSYKALCDDPHAFYVAGSGLTPLAMRPAPNPWIGFDTESGLRPAPAIDFMAGPDGDGTVPWTSALAPARTWYAPCEHGTLPDHTDSFDAYFELLASGSTRRLPQQPPRRRSDADPAVTLVALPRVASPALLPASDEELAQYILQQQHAEPRRALEPDPIEVRVVHGGLDYARYPVIVGHYQHEPLSGASKRVDEKLRGQLRRVLELRLFVGAALTAHYLRPNSHNATEPPYRGALVLGLGSMGELTPGSLADTVTRGVLRYAFEHIHRDPYAPPEDQPVDLRLSTLLVGTQSQAFTVRDSLGGLLFGVWRAAQLLLSMGGERPVRIRELELVEIDEHTALDAAYELRRLLQRGEWAERLRWKRPVLELREGAVSGYRPRSGRSAWQRLIVRGDGAGGLAFSLIGERARVESTRVQSDVQSLARLIDRISDGRAAPDDPIQSPTDPGFGSVLYQLLLPPELKSRLVNLDNTVLVLDRDTARYPWELLSPPLASAADGDKPRPFAVHAGLVRQRDSEDFRRLPTAPTGHHALIVGAPDTGGWQDEQGRALDFSDLPGARAEAELVRRLLEARERWRGPTALISQPPSTDARTPRSRWDGKSFEHVRVALLEKPYRLLHLCGHGVVDQWIRANDGGDGKPVRKTGMVLSDQEVLGAVDVAQMSAVPEFVFINCCYSGRDGDVPAGGDPARARRHAALAASLALAFIEQGAKAVIAAGWQVDDAAALQFAESFYERLLGGLPFGEAVRSSRAEVYARYGEANNTWGAYQCYGDPQWQLAGGETGAPAGGTSRLLDAHVCMSASELAALIQQVLAVAGDKPPREVLGQLDRLVAALQADPLRCGWLDESRVCAALGLAYRELDEHTTAAYHLQRGARTAYSEVQIGQLELLVNSLSRVRGAQGEAAREAARHLLERLNDIADDQPARWPLAPDALPRPAARSERDCLLAGEQLRKASAAMPTAPAALAPRQRDTITAALREAGRLYAQGYRSKCDEGDADARRSYALSNALLAGALLALFGNGASAQAVIGTPPPRPTGPPRRALAERWLHEAELLLDELAAADDQATFWRQAALLELRLARGLFQHTQLKEDVRDPADVAPVRRMIDEVLARWPSPIQLDSLRHRFELVRFVAAHPAPGAVKWARLRHDLALLCEEALDKLTLPRSRTY